MLENYEITIGLEVHAQLDTDTKIFCGCKNEFGAEPNDHTCPICLGLPGTLPVLNKKAVDYIIKAGLALDCEIATFSKFDRKNYFYADLPKAYQISQFDLPFCEDGAITIEVEENNYQIGITRIHLEEDAGKLTHAGDISSADSSLVDYNRVGTPLIEIVSEPDLHSPKQAVAYLKKLKSILEYIAVSDCEMAEGSLRADANLSIAPKGADELGTKTELKNMNSFKAIEKALTYEAKRQAKVLAEGGTIIQGTRTWDGDAGKTLPLREKEEAHDYRYFPEPDLVPVIVKEEWVNEIETSIPELPDARQSRYVNELGIPEYDAGVITADREMADFFEAVVKNYEDAKEVSNWMMGQFSRLLNEEDIEISKIKFAPQDLADLLTMMEEGTISRDIAREVFEDMFTTGKKPEAIVEEKGLKQISDEDELDNIVADVLADNQSAVDDYHGGNKNVIGFLIGQTMQASGGKANPQKVRELLQEKLEE
ncbi:glutamyl-tRNA(Gln) and/or aspartyl-tRNA(Asn) amidotransferase, B subunit [Halobacteroides halobius DSM 5150]|uniref:Aspartyl/glutamyl-tRNA(Asn/Gln) amidotransferase subunit B n=1 Tax=Halobacteroides halobius (strain ATCC 35273 / DSM 5150 / MD-1) TaxID=748449 RepID=L0KC97_HALHC|nr:Asp-tRNA(Asn)/Glu-tRNA(Gln) amidotransferase subunit GatB [Halobacteroides halobius]AGB42175.1 glutamyl-tRNA(Gln) and/or aspartyl-tRNA(Asn) amidotransferase, B subunit [Halobacteroides halobius DSM 5150]